MSCSCTRYECNNILYLFRILLMLTISVCFFVSFYKVRNFEIGPSKSSLTGSSLTSAEIFDLKLESKSLEFNMANTTDTNLSDTSTQESELYTSTQHSELYTSTQQSEPYTSTQESEPYTYAFDPLCNTTQLSNAVIAALTCPTMDTSATDNEINNNKTNNNKNQSHNINKQPYKTNAGCSYSYINPLGVCWYFDTSPCTDYTNVKQKPWFASLAIFTVLVWIAISFLILFADKCTTRLFIVIFIPFLFLCYIGYSLAPDIRLCSPPKRACKSLEDFTYYPCAVDSSNDLLDGCYGEFKTPKKIEWIKSAEEVCRNLYLTYSVDEKQSIIYSAYVPLTSSKKVTSGIKEFRGEIDIIGIIVLSCVAVLFLLDIIESCCFCNNRNGWKDDDRLIQGT